MEFYWDSTVPLKSLSPQKNERCNTVPVFLSFGSSYRKKALPRQNSPPCRENSRSAPNRKPWERRGWRRGNRGDAPHFFRTVPSPLPALTLPHIHHKKVHNRRKKQPIHGERPQGDAPHKGDKRLDGEPAEKEGEKQPGSEQRNIIHREEGPRLEEIVAGGRKHDRHRRHKRIFRGKSALLAKQHPAHNRRTGAGKARPQRHALAKADAERQFGRHLVDTGILGRALRTVAFHKKHQQAADSKRKRHAKGGEKLLDVRMEEQTQNRRRQRRQKKEPNPPQPGKRFRG